MATQETTELEERNLAHFGHMGSDELTITDGDGARVWDDEGNEYLDFSSQLYCVNAGHGNENIVSAMQEQAERIQYVSSAVHNDQRSRLARELVERAPASIEDVYFAISGSEANETVLQVARDYKEAPTVLTRWRSYHGGTYATAGITGDPGMRLSVEKHAATTGSVKFLPPFAGADQPFDADSPEDLAEQAAHHLEYVIKNQGPDSIAALVTEVVGGSSGAYTAPPGYFERVQEICDKYDILLVADEVITGFGRCGEMFGSQTEDLEPDMIAFAKGVTSAYSPLAGVMMSEELGNYLREEEPGVGQTFAGSPIACAAGLAALEEYETLIPNVRELAPVMESRLRDLEAAHDVVGQVRGRGFHWGVEFVDPETGDPVFDPRVESGHNPIHELADVVEEKGVMVGGGRPSFQVTLSPPFCIDEADIHEAIDAMDEGIDEVFG
jgi:taurine--2-oxoglutarate transaminase